MFDERGVSNSEAGDSITPRTDLYVKPDDSALNREHYSIKRIEGIGNLEEAIVVGLSQETQMQMLQAFDVYPQESGLRLLQQEFPHTRINVITPSEKTSTKGLGIVDMGGVMTTGPGSANVISEVFREACNKREASQPAGAHQFPEVKLGVSLSSSVSKEAEEQQFSKNPLGRAAFEAGIIADILQNHPECEEIIVVCRSLGAIDGSYALPLLQNILEQKGLLVKIAGVLLTQPAGMFEQTMPEFVRNSMEANSNKWEIAERYPSLIDIFRAQEMLEKADESEDAFQILHKRMQLERMRQKHSNPERLSDTQRQELQIIDGQIQNAWYNNDNRALKKALEMRYSLLAPIVATAIKASDQRPAKELATPKLFLRSAQAMFGEGGLIHTLPAYVREKITVPIGVLFGEEDRLFSATKAKDNMSNRQFPNAPIEFRGSIAEAAHNSHGSNTRRYAKVVIDTIGHFLNPPKAVPSTRAVELRY